MNNLLAIIAFKTFQCFTVVQDNDSTWENLEQTVQGYNHLTIDVYQTPLAVGSAILSGEVYTIDGFNFTCSDR